MLFSLGGGLLIFTWIIFRKLLRRYRMCSSKASVKGRTVIITGANSGIGRATAVELARRKGRVIVACRKLKCAQKTALDIQTSTGNAEVIPKELDLASMKSIHEFCEQILSEEDRIHILINNAGVFNCPYLRTKDGFEMQMGVNHLGHFLLTNLLLQRLRESAPARIINVSSAFHKSGFIPFNDIHSEHSYNGLQAYRNSKLANCLFTRELSKRLKRSGVDVFAVHPGTVGTNAGRHILPSIVIKLIFPIIIMLGLKDPEEGCQTSVYCSVEESLSGHSGEYYVNCKYEPWSPLVCDDEAAEKLWTLSEQLTQNGSKCD